MKNLFIPYQLAVKAKELGFNEGCFGWYYIPDGKLFGLGSSEALDFRNKKSKKHFCSAPLYQQITDWLREKHKIHIAIDFIGVDLGYGYTGYYEKEGKNRQFSGHGHREDIEIEFTYYQALDKAIEEAFKIIENI